MGRKPWYHPIDSSSGVILTESQSFGLPAPDVAAQKIIVFLGGIAKSGQILSERDSATIRLFMRIISNVAQ